ncbi:MAG: hypothetical protein ACM3MH_05265, partial [Actinomycetota bacterium]
MDLEAARKDLGKRSPLSPKRLGFFAIVALALAAGLLLRLGYFGKADQESGPLLVPALAPSDPDTAPADDSSDSVAKTQAPAPETAPPPSPQAGQPAPAVEQTTQPGAAAGQTEQTEAAAPPAGQQDLPWAGMILVSRQSINVLASPSSSAPTTFGFPAGRSFRVVGREGGFAKIQDVKSGASGWIDEAALAGPAHGQAASTPSRGTAGSASSRGTASSGPSPSQPKPVASGKPA